MAEWVTTAILAIGEGHVLALLRTLAEGANGRLLDDQFLDETVTDDAPERDGWAFCNGVD